MQMPDVVVDYDMKKQDFTVLHQEEVVGLNGQVKSSSSDTTVFPNLSITESQKDLYSDKGKWKRWTGLSEAFSCERIEVVSHDGFMVPLTILCAQKTKHTGGSPCLLHGYGAYGEVLDKSWCSDHVSLLLRGWILAYADVR